MKRQLLHTTKGKIVDLIEKGKITYEDLIGSVYTSAETLKQDVVDEKLSAKEINKISQSIKEKISNYWYDNHKIRKVIYIVTYKFEKLEKIYIGKDETDCTNYLCSVDIDLICQDIEKHGPVQKITKDFLWKSYTANRKELSNKEAHYIEKYGSTDRAIGYNQKTR